jgi:Nucleotidyltransferase of unknown function (DUF6036)
MKRPQLIELLQRIRSNHPVTRLIVAGSQALYATARSVPECVQFSIEADVLLIREAFGDRRDIEQRFGMDSAFQADTGFYAHPVGPGTIVLPSGWEERLVPFGRDDGLDNVWALEIHDLAASKLMASREKDIEFLRALLERGLCDFPTLLARMDLLRTGSAGNAVPERLARLARHLQDWNRSDLARAIPNIPGRPGN